jgi:hypothetical protein
MSIRHFVLFDIMSHLAFLTFDIRSIRRFVPFDILSFRHFLPFDILSFGILSHATLCRLTFCTFGVCYFDILSVNPGILLSATLRTIRILLPVTLWKYKDTLTSHRVELLGYSYQLYCGNTGILLSEPCGATGIYSYQPHCRDTGILLQATVWKHWDSHFSHAAEIL